MNKLKFIVRKLLYKNHYSNDAYIRFLTRGGCKIGENTFFYSPNQKPVDETSLPFIEIGDNCRITDGVRILAHDYSYAVLRRTHHTMLRKTGKTTIGNNCFLGINSIVLMNTTIGDNVIIGAGAVVSGTIPSNSVVAGNPGKVISTIDGNYNKLDSHFIDYASCWFDMKKRSLGRNPSELEMGWFVVLWSSPNREDILRQLRVDGDNIEEVVSDCLQYEPKFASYADFCKYMESR